MNKIYKNEENEAQNRNMRLLWEQTNQRETERVCDAERKGEKEEANAQSFKPTTLTNSTAST